MARCRSSRGSVWPNCLSALGEASRFSAQRAAVPDDLTIEIAGVGPLELSVSAAQVKRLRSIARPARYGLGEQTLIDAGVRDTWELPKSRVRIDRRRWNKTLVPVLDELRAELGLPDGCGLRAQLHSVLMYEQGQFFAPHKDSEKVDVMVGTLVVTLPSTSRGGALVVQHGGRREEYRSSNRLLSFVAFYADCQHEVLPLTSGHRVALTYNLSLEGDSSTGKIDALAVADVSSFLRTHFEAQDRLVYLLDHKYTEHGLSFERLKGVDAGRVAVLRAAARERDDEIVLALADVHETWSCDEPYQRHGWYDQYDDDAAEPDTGPYDLGEQLTVGAIEGLAEITRMRLSARLARPARDPDDWSICAPDTCTCQLCDKLRAFLVDAGCQHLDWPLAEQGRRHVHDRIDRNELPVRHETRRSGRPYTLVLTKTSALFERERRVRDVDLVDLRWLETIPLPRPERDDDHRACSTAKA